MAGDLGTKCLDCGRVRRNRVIRHVPAYYRAEPSPLLRDGLVAALLHFARELVQLRRHPPPLRMPHQEKLPLPGAPADVREPQKVESLWLPAEATFPSS